MAELYPLYLDNFISDSHMVMPRFPPWYVMKECQLGR